MCLKVVKVHIRLQNIALCRLAFLLRDEQLGLLKQLTASTAGRCLCTVVGCSAVPATRPLISPASESTASGLWVLVLLIDLGSTAGTT